jgi:hypothetical protein
MKKEIKKTIKKGIIIGFSLAFIVGMMVWVAVLYSVYHEPSIGQNLILDRALNNGFTRVSNSWENTQVVDSLSYLCYLNENDLERTRCVYNFILLNTEYGAHDGKTNILRTPEEMFNETIVCRDVSVLVKSTLDKMNISNEFVNEPKHIYNLVYLDDRTCIVDIVNGIFKCYDYTLK